MVIAAFVRVDFRRASELGGEDDKGVVEQTAAVEIVEQGGKSLVEDLRLFREVDEIRIVGIPPTGGHFDTTDTVFHEATGEEDALAKRIIAVAVASRARIPWKDRTQPSPGYP